VNKEDDAEEDDDVEDEDNSLSSRWELQTKAFGYLGLGTLLVTVFSDPMVEVIGNIAQTLDISPFYVSFIVTPIASNASEAFSALIFAMKKSNKSISLTYAALYGAATMNNTLCLSIFMALLYFRGLAWDYTAEVSTIMIVTVIVGINGMRTTIHMWQAVLVFLLYPSSLLLVSFLERLGFK